VTGYCLNPEHDEGRHKANLFQELLGVTMDNGQLLFDALKDAASSREALIGKIDKSCQRYIIVFDITGPAGTAVLRSAWIIRSGEAVPRLVACLILQTGRKNQTMKTSRQRKLLDVVAVLNSPVDIDVQVGDVGTVVELLPPDGVEVEFLGRDGRTRCVATLAVADVLPLNP
jgi:Domain of unknown function (DUF4926)